MSVSDVPMTTHEVRLYEVPLTYADDRPGLIARMRSQISDAEMAAVRSWFVWSVGLTLVATTALMVLAEPSTPHWDTPVLPY